MYKWQHILKNDFFILKVKGQGKRKRKHEEADSEADKAKVGHYRELDSAQNLTVQRMAMFIVECI